MLQALLKRFAESATGFAYRYRKDPFYRTGWNVVLLQIGFAIVLLAITLVSINALYDEVVDGLVTSIVHAVASGTSPEVAGFSISNSLEYERQKSMLYSTTGILIAAAVFSWLITLIALTPTRNALDSQKRFVGNIAHELRTPLSIIKTNTEVALFDDDLDRSLRETLESNVEELDRISDIINNLLSMNALLRPEKIELTTTDLGPIVSRVVTVLGELAEHKSIRVETSALTSRMVWGNTAALEQILMNVVKNAINYTPQGGKVLISVEPGMGGRVEIRVEDTGMGIDEKDLERIFEPFFRGDASRNRKSGGGSGLGLAIVSELVKLHKGSIRIRSTLGAGTTVTISLPPGRDKNDRRNSSSQDRNETRIDFSKAKT